MPAEPLRQPSPGPDARWSAPGSAESRPERPGARFFLLGFLTLAVQVVLLRELFCVLYGSDLAFGFALAAWTVLTALGALAQARSGRVPAGVGRWGSGLYAVLGAGVFLGARAWGSQEIIPFHAYLLIPVLLAPLCLLGGALFPWYLREKPGYSPTAAYAWEVAGGLVAGLASAVAFRLGALACPFLAGLLLLGVAWGAAGTSRRRRRVALLLAALVLALLPVSTPGLALEKLSLRLRVRQGRVVAAANTPFASLVAVRDAQGQSAVFENGTPWPLPEATVAREAIATVLQALPAGSDRAIYIHALRAGFGAVLGAGPWTRPPRFVETDPLAVSFARQHLGGLRTDCQPVPFAGDALEPEAGGWDLVAVLSPGPAGLLANRPLTREFAAQVRPRLSARGVFVIALPAAPGFTHPAQEAYTETVAQALRTEFPGFSELRTQGGWTLLVAGLAPLDRQAVAGRALARSYGAAPGVVAEVLDILSGAGALSLDVLAGLGGREDAGGRPGPTNQIGAPRAYFRFLQFRGHLIEDAPGWWRWLFQERRPSSCMGVLLVILLAGAARRRGRSLLGVFWAAWGATLTLIFAIYLCQSLAGEAFWSVGLLSAASLGGILAGTRWRRGGAADRAVVWLAWAPAALFPLYALLEHWPAGPALGLLVAWVAAAGACLGAVFARRSEVGDDLARGGTLFAVDLLGGGAGLFLGGVLLPWWSGFETPALVGSLITCAVLLWPACNRHAA